MAVALDLGGTPVAVGELQAAVEDYTVSQSAEFDVEHDHRGRHTKPFESLEVEGLSQTLGGLVIGAMLALEEGFAVELTTDTDDLTDADGSAIEDVVIRLQSTGDVDLTGIVPADPTKRQVHLLEHGGAGTTITLHHNTTSTYPFSLPASSNLDLTSGQVILIQWDPNSDVWRMVIGGGSVVKSIQRVTVTYATGATTATQAMTAVSLAKSDISMIGEFHTTAAGPPTLQNVSQLDLLNTTSTTIALKRASGVDSGSSNITSTTVIVQVVEYV